MTGLTWSAFITRYFVELNLHICIPLVISAIASITLAIQVKAEAKNNAKEFKHVHYKIDANGKRIEIAEAGIKEIEKTQADTKQDIAEIKLQQKYGRFWLGKEEEEEKTA